ncbi:EF-hand domain-containing family member C2 [Cimex lectularius]|uniref:EF-hand domain-containing family member C2 n=1 Tax=Cimex lectularius TaxID=79782 RepID=A0A8I6S8S1_CIMLE|nr:EF-hand domain-containing family member C2 [Cimex lectularius]
MTMNRTVQLPCLPGYSVNTNVGQTRFHLAHHFDFIHKGVPYLTEKKKPGIGGVPLPGSDQGSYPSIYARGEVSELPPWIIYDKHILAFDGYYMESADCADFKTPYSVHKVKVLFYLEDGTIKVIEPQQMNSGTPQGCLIKRHRIRYADSGHNDEFYDIIDFNIGKELQLYGKNITLVNCDSFTRIFLNRLGIPVPDPMAMPEDPYMKERKKIDNVQKRKKVNVKKTVNRFLEMDNRILSFDAYWDDSQTEFGYVHLLKIYYYLIDDTIEISDVTDPDHTFLISKRGKLPKEYFGLPQPGEDEPVSLLNVLGGVRSKARYVVDPLGMGTPHKQYYMDRDIAIGAVINSYGRRFVIFDCDSFTKDYYRLKFGMDDFRPFPRPPTAKEKEMASTKKVDIPIPPYNGFGTYEDSLLNCLSVNPFAIVKEYKQFFELDKVGYDSRILRFSARMISNNELGNRRKFILSYFLCDDTLQINDHVPRNSGYTGGKLIARRKVLKHGQNIYGTKPHEYVTYEDLFIGNIVIIEDFTFYLDGADEYALKYMEQHPDKFPRSNIRLVMDKLREAVKPVYKQFASQFLQGDNFVPIPYATFRNAVKALIGDKITDQEIITIGRYFRHTIEKEPYPLEILQRLAHDILRKELFIEFHKLREAFQHFDPDKTGYVTRDIAYSVLRGCKVPLDVEFLKLILERLGQGEQCIICCDEIVEFLNYRNKELKPIPPINTSGTFSWLNLCRPETLSTETLQVSISGILDELQLERELKQQCH